MSNLDSRTDELLEHALQARDAVLAHMTKMSAKPSEVYAKTIYAAFLVRISRIFGAYADLLRTGYGPESQLLVRPFLETLVDWLYIETDPVNLGERYVLYEAASHIQFLRDHGHTDKAAALVAAHGDHAHTFCCNYGYAKGRVPREWCDKSIEYRAKKGGLRHIDRIYPGLCDLLHNSPVGLPNYAEIDDTGTLVLRTEASSAGTEWMTGWLCCAFLVCLEKANSHFSLGCEQVIDATGAKWKEFTGVVSQDDTCSDGATTTPGN